MSCFNKAAFKLLGIRNMVMSIDSVNRLPQCGFIFLTCVSDFNPKFDSMFASWTGTYCQSVSVREMLRQLQLHFHCYTSCGKLFVLLKLLTELTRRTVWAIEVVQVMHSMPQPFLSFFYQTCRSHQSCKPEVYESVWASCSVCFSKLSVMWDHDSDSGLLTNALSINNHCWQHFVVDVRLAY